MSEREKEVLLLRKWAVALFDCDWDDIVQNYTAKCLRQAKEWANAQTATAEMDALLAKVSGKHESKPKPQPSEL